VFSSQGLWSKGSTKQSPWGPIRLAKRFSQGHWDNNEPWLILGPAPNSVSRERERRRKATNERGISQGRD